MPPTLDPLFAVIQQGLAGRYSLDRELGRGGMGIVYLAHDVRLERLVAVKVLPPEVAVHAGLRERFLREARTAARLSHPNIVPIHAVDEVAGFVYFAMTYVPGETLASRVQSRGPLAPTEAARVLREVAWALSYAHAQGVVHRDIKPENVLLELGTGRAMVADFGIASVESAPRETSPGQIMGTPEFMSPEQASGEAVDGRSDLYAVGALGFYLLSGKPPFQGPSAAKLLAQHLTAPVPSLAAVVPGLPDALALLLERCLAKDPDQRPSDGKQLAEELGVVLQSDPEPPAALRAMLRNVSMSAVAVMVSAIGVPLIIRFEETPIQLQVIARVMVGLSLAGVILAFAIPRHLRQLQEAGYSPEDVAQMADTLSRRRREEEEFLAKWNPSRTPKRGQLMLWLFLSVFLMDGISELLSPTTNWSELAVLGMFGMACIAQLKSFQALWRGSSEAGSSPTGRLWRSRLLARLWRRLTGASAKSTTLQDHRPTEIRLRLTFDDLFAGLPSGMQGQLKELPPLVRHLEARSHGLRIRLAELDRLLAEAGRDPGDDASHGERTALRGVLGTTRATVAARLEAAVAALENIRLDLWRLRAGDSTLDRITADLAAAAEIAAQTDRLLEAGNEVARLVE